MWSKQLSWKVILNRCPEFKGIETTKAFKYAKGLPLNRCPEFKGIETGVPEVTLVLVY